MAALRIVPVAMDSVIQLATKTLQRVELIANLAQRMLFVGTERVNPLAVKTHKIAPIVSHLRHVSAGTASAICNAANLVFVLKIARWSHHVSVEMVFVISNAVNKIFAP